MVRGRRSSSRFTPSLPEKPGLSPTLPGPLPSPMRTPLQPLFRLESPETPRSPWVQVCMAGAGPQCRLKHPGSGLQPSSASQLKEKTPEGGGGAGRPGCAAAEGPSCSIWKKRALRGLAGRSRPIVALARAGPRGRFLLRLGQEVRPAPQRLPGGLSSLSHPGRARVWGDGAEGGDSVSLLLAQLGVLLQQPLQGLHKVRHTTVLGNVPEGSNLLHEDLREGSGCEPLPRRGAGTEAEEGAQGGAEGRAAPWCGW